MNRFGDPTLNLLIAPLLPFSLIKAFASPGLIRGHSSKSPATTPPTNGEAIDVPEST